MNYFRPNGEKSEFNNYVDYGFRGGAISKFGVYVGGDSVDLGAQFGVEGAGFAAGFAL